MRWRDGVGWRDGGAGREPEVAQRLRDLVGRVTADSRREWLVVASVVVLIVLAVTLGWIRVDLGRPF